MTAVAKYQDVSVIILTGGQSKRMGTDKGRLEVSESTFFNHVLKLAQQISNQIFISVGIHNQEHYQNTNAMVVTDVVSNKGPMGGITSILPHITTHWLFVVSVDTPRVTGNMFRKLWDFKGGYEAVTFSSDNKIHPLIGLYSSNTFTSWNNAFDKDELKITSLVKSFNINVIDADNETAKRLRNINTPQEYKELLESV